MAPTKRKSNYDTSDPFVVPDNDIDSSTLQPNSTQSARPTKRTKPSTSNSSKTSTSKTSRSASVQKDDEGNPYWSISTARRVTVSDFKGKKMVSVREYYQRDGEWLPGKKGITMTLEQYAEFVKVMPLIEKALGKDGEKVGRPVYGNGRTGALGDEEQDGGVEVDVDVESEDDGDGDGDGNNDDDDDGMANGSRARKANIEATSDEDED